MHYKDVVRMHNKNIALVHRVLYCMLQQMTHRFIWEQITCVVNENMHAWWCKWLQTAKQYHRLPSNTCAWPQLLQKHCMRVNGTCHVPSCIKQKPKHEITPPKTPSGHKKYSFFSVHFDSLLLEIVWILNNNETTIRTLLLLLCRYSKTFMLGNKTCWKIQF